MKLLLVEDDAMIADAVRMALTDLGYAVDLAGDGAGADSALREHGYQLVLLDITLPRLDGLSLLRLLRLRNDWVPVILMTARQEAAQRAEGLDLGADDYVVKPFHMVELVARMRAVMRRHRGPTAGLLAHGALRLDIDKREARRGERHARLTANETVLLHALLSRPGVVLTRRELQSRIYGKDGEGGSSLDFLIHGIRKKLGADLVLNVRGAGWMVDDID
ncbi:MAG: response regulator transcription factor [Betaproteobacteria bacterium]|nr:response regulator transcription factor [Betaproteobacteria bacterium]